MRPAIARTDPRPRRARSGRAARAPVLGDCPILDEALAGLGRRLGARALLLTGPRAEGAARLAAWGSAPRAASWPPAAGWLAWPLSAAGREEGALWARAGAWQASGEAQAALQASLPLLAALVASHARWQREREHQLLADTLQAVARALTSTLNLDEVLARILDGLARLVPYDSATVMLLEDGVLRLHAQRGYRGRPDALTRVRFSTERTAMIKEVLGGDQPLILPDIRQVPDWEWVEGSRHIRSWMSVPLRMADRVTGLFSIDKVEPNFFTPRHAALAAAFAPHAAIAIENARLFDELKAAEAQLRGLSLRVIEAQEAERQRIARELHDQAGQALLALRAELRLLARQVPPEAALAHTQLARVDEIVRLTARDLRALSHELRSHLLGELGLASALQEHLRDFHSRFGLQTDLAVDGQAMGRLPRPVELAAFRVAQEALTNVVRHAQAQRLTVRLSVAAGELRLQVQDDGQGFDPSDPGERPCLGLVGMRERAAAVGGRIGVHSRPGEGTEIVAEFPLARDD